MLSAAEHLASGAGLDRLATRLIAGYAARCAVRSRIREERSATDRKEYLPDGIFASIADGTIALTRKDSTHFLWLEWDGAYGQRLLAQSDHLADVERVWVEVAVHGPAGGPDFRGFGSEWHRRLDEGTEHSLTLGGEFRLMRLFGGEHLLIVARNDGGGSVLGRGDAEELKRTARDRLKGFVGDALNVNVGDARLQLRAVGAAGVLGYLEMFDGTTMLLGHLSGRCFGLFHVRGGKGQCVGLYDIEDLERGDLGQVLRWTGGIEEAEEGELAEDDGGDPAERGVHGGDQVHRVHRPRARAARRRSPARRPAHRAQLSAVEVRTIARHMRARQTMTGPGSTIFEKLLAGIGVLACLGLSNQLLYGCDLLRLLKERAGVEIHCCSRTLSSALAAVAAHTSMVVAVNKRWLLRFGDLLLVDSDLMRWIIGQTSEATEEAADELAPASARSSMPVISEPLADPDQLVTAPASAPGAPAIATGCVALDPERQESELDLDDILNGQSPILTGYRRRLKRREGHLRTTRAGVPTAESASRWEPKRDAKKRGGRGPPW